MAERYQDHRHIPDDDEPVVTSREPVPADGDPLAELARLIGQSDPFANFGRSNPTHPVRHATRSAARTPPPDHAADEYFDREVFDQAPARPAWLQRAESIAASEPEPEEPIYNSRPHPLHRVRSQPQESPAEFDEEPAAYQPAADAQTLPPEEEGYHPDHAQPAYDDAYGYEGEYAEQDELPYEKPRRTGVWLAAGVFVLAIVGTGGAFAYRTYVLAPRSANPPVITADTTPTKVVPAADPNNKPIQDRLGAPAGENVVSREEKPVDVRDPTKAGARNPFPPPTLPSTAKATTPGPSGNTQLPGGDEPRKIRTFVVKGDPSDVAQTPVAKQAPKMTPPSTPPRTTASTPISSGPMSLAPQSAPAAASTSGGYVVQLSSQRSESDAQASYRALQSKFPAVLGSRSPLIKRADLGEKGTFYRAAVGPFATPEEAAQVCGNLKTAGGQCVVQRN